MNYDTVWKYSNNDDKLYQLEERYDKDSEFELYSPDDDATITNMSCLKFINIPTILNVLELRYRMNEIYSYNGNVLISINPFKKIETLYTKIDDLDIDVPHIYSIAERAYRNYKGQNQSILVSGESGSGKTENTKYILKYLSSKYADNDKTALNIINSNHIIEMLGNSKTMRNDNSSRFGKFIKLYLSGEKIVGANIDNYLLEKSRITVFNKHERSYHLFYALQSPKLETYRFRDNYRLLTETDSSIIDEFKDVDEFLQALSTFDFMSGDLDKIFYTIKIVLELLDIVDVSDFDLKGIGFLTVEFKFLEIDVEQLIFNFKHKTIKVGGETIHTLLEDEYVLIQIKSYCEDLYGELFDWIISKINIKLGTKSDKYISILDIFGFEILEQNGYEQLCINYTNEILQQIYNKNVLENEQMEYIKEGIGWDMINYNSNNHIIELFNAKLSIFGIINEQSILGSGSDENIYNNFKTKLCAKSDIITISNRDFCQQKFNISHYAGEVSYVVDNYILKNRIKSKNRKIKTNLHLFSSQLDVLRRELHKNNCLFVRCIKPNDTNNSDNYNQTKINEQLLYSGIIEGIKLILQGFPVKINLNTLGEEFRFLGINILGNGCVGNTKDIIDILIKNKEYGNQYAIGKSKLFLKKDLYNNLLKQNDELRYDLVVFVQKNLRKCLCKKRYIRVLRMTVVVQGFARIVIAKNVTYTLRIARATCIISNRIYTYMIRRGFLMKKQASIYLQSVFRKYNQMVQYTTLLTNKIVKSCLNNLVELCVTEHINYLDRNATTITMLFIRFKLNKRIKNRSDVDYLKKVLAMKEKEVLDKLSEQNECTLMGSEEASVRNYIQSIRQLKLIEQLRIDQQNCKKEQEDKRTNELKEKEVELQNSLLEIEKLKQLLKAKNNNSVGDLHVHPNSKINNVRSDYVLKKNDPRKFYDISLDGDSAVKQVGQKLERMYLDLNEKNTRIDFLIKKYRELEEKKKDKNCRIM